jgi:hypothetical protein
MLIVKRVSEEFVCHSLIIVGYRQVVHETSQSSSQYAEKSPALVRLLMEPVMTYHVTYLETTNKEDHTAA